MSSFKNDSHDLGNGWGWFVSIDYKDTHKLKQNMPTILPLHKRQKLETMKSIRSMKSTSNLKNLQNDYEYDYDNKKEDDEKYSIWGVNAICILSIVAFGFIIL